MKIVHGIPAAPGLGIGTAHTIRPLPTIDPSAQHAGNASQEHTRLEQAIGKALARLDTLAGSAGGATADILMAQRELLDDPELKQGSDDLIDTGSTAEAAITQIAASYAAQLTALPDPYLAARAEDVKEVGRRIVAELLGISLEIHLDQPTILIAQDLSPAQTIGLNPEHIQAIVTESGTATGHLAIVAQGLGIPTIAGVQTALAEIAEGTLLIVDGNQGTIIIEPDEANLLTAQARLQAARQEKEQLHQYRDRPGLTADGVHVDVFANIGSLVEARKAVEIGAQGVGLFRTELLANQGLPSENEQYAIYQEVAAILQRPLIVRTFDIGGDKPIPGLDIPPETNPFLGWRGIRLGIDRPQEILMPQLRALLRAGAQHDVRIMLPMVTVPQEVKAVRAQLDHAFQDLQAAGHNVRPIPLGIMVETPAAALTLDRFKGLIDFASIGTNDLVQYTYAVDRTNTHVRERAQPLGLATLRLIDRICKAGIPTAVCGQMAGDPDAIPILVGLGVRELSVAPAHIPTVKHTLRAQTLAEMQALARQALTFTHA